MCRNLIILVLYKIFFTPLYSSSGKDGYKMFVMEHLQRKIFDLLRDFASFIQYKKREKHSWRSTTFTFSRFLNCKLG